MKLRVDVGGTTFLAVCECGRRYLAFTHLRALERMADHERDTHPDDRNARAALAMYRKRHAGQR